MAPSVDIQHIWVIAGPAGCGKTTIANFLAQKLSVPCIEGDDIHQPTSIAKMGSGQQLSDIERWDWLIALRNEALKKLQTNRSVVLTCSALKRKYRDILRIASYGQPCIRLHFIYLKADKQALTDRVAARVDHFMKAGMVESQLLILEEPNVKEEPDALLIDVCTNSGVDAVQSQVLDVVKRMLADSVCQSTVI